MTIASPILLAMTLLLMIATIVVARLRRVRLPVGAAVAILCGMGLLALAAGGAGIRWPDPRRALVMIDLSPSTRTATYRDPQARDARIRHLLGEVPYTVQTFAEGEQLDKTEFSPPPADAIVLFSDALFDLPKTAPPTYVIVDPALEAPTDAAVSQLEVSGEELSATIRNSGAPRSMYFTGAVGPTTAPSGNSIINATIDSAAPMITARVGPADAWPENDALSIRPPQRRQYETWWIDNSSWPGNYRAMRPTDLPTDPAAYLPASVIVINNLPASSFSPVQQQRLMQYVRDLGGGLVLLGGEQAFAAGGYLGTLLDALSPLASAPSQAQRYWIILADSSGSMAAPIDGQTRWQRAAAAVSKLLGALPPNDPVSIGSFARDVRWWSQGKTAAESSSVPIPQDISPSGPTNIQAVLAALAGQLRNDVTAEIILISDGDATIDNPQALATELSQSHARVNLLLTGQNPPPPVLQVVAMTAGKMIAQADSTIWAQDAIKLAKSTMRDYLERRPTSVTFSGSLQQLPVREVPLWNRTWLREGATELATTRENNAPIRMSAIWQVGAGLVAAAAFPADGSEAQALASLAERAPQDPRFTITHSAGTDLFVRVDAASDNAYLNNLTLSASLLNETDISSPPTFPFIQTGPGRYELSIPAPKTPALVTIRSQDHLIDRFAVAGRYPPEFERIGNNHDAMASLAKLSGGEVIEPTRTTPIDFHWPSRRVSLVSILAIAGAGCIALGLVIWKIR